jgi:hypothetical protein
VLASGTVFVAFGSCAWLPAAAAGPSTPSDATPGPRMPTQVMSMFGL